MLDIIVEETNRYTYQFISKNIDYLNQHKYSKAHRWKNTTNEEIRRFIGVEILMSLLPLQNIRYYWIKDELLETNVRNFMSEDRFNLLKKFLRINNNEDCDKSDRLYKIRKFSNMMRKNFKKLCTPGMFCTIDENMIPTKLGPE